MKGYCVLETGEVYEGLWAGGKARAGEVVFNTSHSGYEEIATDPSYYSQIVVMTAPMMGNYGADRSVWESKRLWIEGFVCLNIQNSVRDSAWLESLKTVDIPVIHEIDTRSLVLRLRSGGTPWGALVPAATKEQAKQMASELISLAKNKDKDWVWAASSREMQLRQGQNPEGLKIALLDFGCKENIIRESLPYAKEIAVFPSRTSVDDIKAYNPDRILLSNGPGDPADVLKATETVKELIGWRPLMGICMGHQILGLALGAKTYKLKFGHRGSNHPVKDELLKQVYMTAQNHGYAVDAKSLPADVTVTHTNLNDQTVSGFWGKDKRILGIQFHPESHPGPHEAQGLFEFFAKRL